LSANDESALTLLRHLRPAVPLSLSLLRHQHTVVAVCTVRFALLPKTFHLAQTGTVLTSIQLKQIWTRAHTHVYKHGWESSGGFLDWKCYGLYCEAALRVCWNSKSANWKVL